MPSPHKSPDFERIFVLGDIDPKMLGLAMANVLPLPASDLERARSIPVAALIQLVKRHQMHGATGGGFILILTDRELQVPELQCLFGFSDRRAKIAIVSTFHLRDRIQPDRLTKRVANEIAHELGHLQGLRHCRRSCVMHPVRSPEELDSRPVERCDRCPKVGRFGRLLRSVAAVSLLVLTLAAFDTGLLPLTGPAFDAPFT